MLPRNLIFIYSISFPNKILLIIIFYIPNKSLEDIIEKGFIYFFYRIFCKWNSRIYKTPNFYGDMLTRSDREEKVLVRLLVVGTTDFYITFSVVYILIGENSSDSMRYKLIIESIWRLIHGKVSIIILYGIICISKIYKIILEPIPVLPFSFVESIQKFCKIFCNYWCLSDEGIRFEKTVITLSVLFFREINADILRKLF
jgi:hypothetical protein